MSSNLSNPVHSNWLWIWDFFTHNKQPYTNNLTNDNSISNFLKITYVALIYSNYSKTIILRKKNIYHLLDIYRALNGTLHGVRAWVRRAWVGAVGIPDPFGLGSLNRVPMVMVVACPGRGVRRRRGRAASVAWIHEGSHFSCGAPADFDRAEILRKAYENMCKTYSSHQFLGQ